MQKVNYESIKTRLDTDERADFDFQRRRHVQWTENYELYRDTVVVNRLTQRQSVNIPLMKGTIKTVLANTDEFPDLHFEEKGNNKAKELFFNELWRDTVEKDRMEIKDILDKKQEYLYGRTWRKLNISRGRFESEVLEPFDVLVDRYVDPTDLETADHLTHVNIFRTLGQLSANPFYDQDAVNRLKIFYGTKSGLIKAEEITQQLYRKNQRLMDMGVPGINSPILGETVVELKAHFVKVFDDVDQQNHTHLIVTCDGEILQAKPLKEILNIDFYPLVTWADDPERNDFYSDGIADIARTPNKILNVWFSQLVENRTLKNFSMNFYDATKEGFVPQTFDPIPGGYIPVPGNPKDVLMPVPIGDLDQAIDEIDYVKKLVESATAATATTKGESEKGKITLGEVELVTQTAMERITSIAKFYNLAQKEFGQKWSQIVNANGDKLDAVVLYKKSHKGNYFKKKVSPSDWQSTEGYVCTVESSSERDKKNMDTVQKITAVAAQFPGNIPMIKIKDKKLLEFADLNTDEIAEVMAFEEQQLKKNPALGPQLSQPSPATASSPVTPQPNAVPAPQPA